MTEENWLPVVGYEGLYEVSDQGRVRRLPSGVILKVSFDRCGYHKVSLGSNGNWKQRLVHILVVEAFIRKKEPGEVVCHGPAGQDDNSLSNLYFSTQSKNNKEDKRRDGTANIGDAHPCAKITEADAIHILESRGKIKQSELAKQYGITQQTVSAIQVGRKWPHLQTKEGRTMAAHATRNRARKSHSSPFS